MWEHLGGLLWPHKRRRCVWIVPFFFFYGLLCVSKFVSDFDSSILLVWSRLLWVWIDCKIVLFFIYMFFFFGWFYLLCVFLSCKFKTYVDGSGEYRTFCSVYWGLLVITIYFYCGGSQFCALDNWFFLFPSLRVFLTFQILDVVV